MFSDIAPVYDLMKAHRDYAGEARVICDLLRQDAPGAKTLLEVACGTGSLLQLLDDFDRTGLDISTQMLDVGRKKLGHDVALHQGEMESFTLPRPFEVLLCLDGAIGYVPAAQLRTTLSNFARHLVSGGLLVVEPWFTPEEWKPGTVHLVHHRGEDATVVRLGFGYPSGTIEFHNVVGTADGIRHFDERYDFSLHTHEALASALDDAGFIDIREEATSCFGRGLFVARKP